VISIGTEKMKVEQAKMNLLQKAKARPDQVRKVLDTARNLGWKAALEKVRNRLETPTPMGYSAAGIIESIDPGNTRFRVGDRVSCSGAECAFHAEWVAVPDLLMAKVPEGVEGWQAAYTTIAAIALQGVRQLEPQLGDRVLVMGQGLVGLLVTNILAASGCRVMAVDLAAARKPFALGVGAERVVIVGQQNLADEVRSWTITMPRSNRRPMRCAIAAALSLSVILGRIAPGRFFTRRNWTSATRAPTGRAATTQLTNGRGWTIQLAMCGGPKEGISNPSCI
jgi:threonine dehydrogenase-like Zn-dependent dehydrogenase